jgi:hypothetical protein
MYPKNKADIPMIPISTATCAAGILLKSIVISFGLYDIGDDGLRKGDVLYC